MKAGASLGYLILGLAAGTAGVWAVRKAIVRKKSLEAQGELARPAPSLEELIPESKFIEINGIRIHYVQAGEGPDVVLLHGIGASTFIWRMLFPLLQARHRVTAIDLPGFGKSAKNASHDYGLDAQTKAIAAAIEVIGIQNPLLVGSSMGGAIALWLAKLYPERFPRVATLAPAIDSSLVPTQIRLLANAAPMFRHAINRKTMKLILSRVLRRRDLITDQVVDAYLQPFLDKGEAVRAFWSATSLIADRRLPAELAGLGSQVLIIYGERDQMISRKSIEKLLRVLPHAQLICHIDGGHHIMEDEPAWTAHTLEEFFRAT